MMRAPLALYSAEPPLCRQCGGLFTNPSATQCRFCSHPAHAPATAHRPTGPMPMIAPAPQFPMQHHAGGRTSFFWLRVVVIAIASCLSVVAACVGALAGD